MDETTATEPKMKGNAQPPGSPVYGLGVVGAAVYFFARAASWQQYALALPKALVWPALLVYRALADREGSADA